MTTAAQSRRPHEPVLDMTDIQGIAVPGFFKPYQMLLGVRYARDPDTVSGLRRWLHAVAPQIATAAATLHDRRGHRAKPAPMGERPAGEPSVGGRPAGEHATGPHSAGEHSAGEHAAGEHKAWPPLVAVGFSYAGLFDLAPSAALLPGEAFKTGLAGRSALLGDPTDPANPGHPSNWSVGGPGHELDLLIVVAGDDRTSVEARAAALETALTDLKLQVLRQAGHVRDDVEGQSGHEHFGFDDGVSQPGIRGRATPEPHDFITERHVDAAEQPAAALFGYPGQDLVWPGEFLIGYPQTGPDPLIPGPVLEPTIPWARNGSFLVYRRLRQEVGLFWKTMKSEAERLSHLSGFSDFYDVKLAAKLVGRWPSGAPVSRTPAADDEDLGCNQFANNHFRFDSATPALKLAHGADPFLQAAADPIGAVCPLGAHIRKVNTRDAPSDMGARSSTYERRLLRVGVPFGPSVVDRYAEPTADDPERGLLFLSIQSSIEDQFEFLQARWMNDDTRPKAPSGHDMIVGQNTPTADGVRRATLFGSALQQTYVEAKDQFVVPTGGGYFFVPSLSALGEVIGHP